MKKTVLFSLVILLIAVLAVMSSTPGAAKASKITTCALQTNTAEIPGKIWFSDDGTIMHIRGQITYADITPLAGHPECDPVYSRGQMEMEVNINLNLVTGEGNAYGKHTITVDGFHGAWVGTHRGKIENFVYSGRAISHGTGELEGMLQKVNIVQAGETTYETYGYVLIP
jgi:hypothetical protein